MSEDIRYKIQHMGDIFVDSLSSVVDYAQKLAKGVVISYDIRDLRNKKQECLSDIGQRIVQAKKAGLADLQRDDLLVGLFSKAQNIGQLIKAYEQKKQGTA